MLRIFSYIIAVLAIIFDFQLLFSYDQYMHIFIRLDVKILTVCILIYKIINYNSYSTGNGETTLDEMTEYFTDVSSNNFSLFLF